MKCHVALLVSLIAALLLFDTLADTASDETNGADGERELWRKKTKRWRKQKRRHNRRKKKNNWKKPHNWKKPNDWKGYEDNKDDDMKLMFIEGECKYDYKSLAFPELTPEEYPIDSEGTLNPESGWDVGDYFFKTCDLFYNGYSNLGPMRSGTTNYTCFATKVTEVQTAGNDATFDCKIMDEITYNKYENYDSYGYNSGMDTGYLHYTDKYYASTIESVGIMKGYDTDFRLATVGGTGGGVGASGQLSVIESEYKMKYVHSYYIDAPHLRKGFPW